MSHHIHLIEDIIQLRFSNPEFNVQMLAEELHLSTTYLRELTWRACGRCPYDMIENKRLEKALSLIHDDRLNLYQVCALSGYASPQTLRDAFKKRFGETPAEIRAQLHRRGRPLILKTYLERLRGNVLKPI